MGAIPFVKTTSPIAIHLDTLSPLYGQATNAIDLNRIAGGSSGGEGGMIKSGCSVIGIGSDIGGSNRIPSCF